MERSSKSTRNDIVRSFEIVKENIPVFIFLLGGNLIVSSLLLIQLVEL